MKAEYTISVGYTFIKERYNGRSYSVCTNLYATFWALIPPLVAIILALITKEVYSSLILGIVAGVLMYTGFNPWQAFLAFYDIMKNSMNLNILIFDIMLGVVIVLMVGRSVLKSLWRVGC